MTFRKFFKFQVKTSRQKINPDFFFKILKCVFIEAKTCNVSAGSVSVIDNISFIYALDTLHSVGYLDFCRF